jgi:3-isopropylmalate/(R)-2-methylmalate dehydratase small subunit
VVIAKSFADIFSNTSGKNGLLLVTLPAPVVDELMSQAASSELRLTVSLAEQTVSTADGRSWTFSYDSFLKYCLLNGLDEMEHLRSQLETIGSFKKRQRENWFFDARTPNNG